MKNDVLDNTFFFFGSFFFLRIYLLFLHASM